MKIFLAGLLGAVIVVVFCLYALRDVGEARSAVFQSVSVDRAGNLLMIEYPDFHITKALVADGYATRETIRTDAFVRPVCAGIDGDGNLFVIDGEGDAIKELIAADDYRVWKTLATGVVGTSPFCSLAIDGSGNIFRFEAEAVTEILAEGGYVTVKPLAKGHFGIRHGGTVDALGNIFVLDSGAVKEIAAESGYTEARTIASNVYTLNGSLAVDAVGNIFIANDEAVKEIPAEGGYAQIRTLTNKRYFFPQGTAVDRDGNLIVVDFPVRRVDEVFAKGGYSEVKSLAAVDDSLAYQAKRFLANRLGVGTTTVTVVTAGPTVAGVAGPTTVAIAGPTSTAVAVSGPSTANLARPPASVGAPPPQPAISGWPSMPASPEAARSAAEKAVEEITACVKKRLRGDLPSHVSSTDCSAPGIRAAYEAVHYPYMDLIETLIDKRRELAGQLDQELATDQQMRIEQQDFLKGIEEIAQKRRDGVSP